MCHDGGTDLCVMTLRMGLPNFSGSVILPYILTLN